jgi:hypothetical protein
MLGMGLGIYMAMSHDHRQHVTHAHLLLLGFVASVLYAAVYRLWLAGTSPVIALTQVVLHQAGSALLVTGLLLLYGNAVSESTLGPLLGSGSLAVLAAAGLMMFQVLRADSVQRAIRDDEALC